MNGLKKEKQFGRTDDASDDARQPAMFRVRCPLREDCPYYGEHKTVGDKRQCYGRLFDLAETNPPVWLKFRCQRTKRVILIKQTGTRLFFREQTDSLMAPPLFMPAVFTPLRCPICGHWIMELGGEPAGFTVSFKCPGHRRIVSWDDYDHPI